MSEQAQSRLLSGTVAVLGLGSWGRYAAQYLSEVGIGCLVCVDENGESLREIQEFVHKSHAPGADSRRANSDTQGTQHVSSPRSDASGINADSGRRMSNRMIPPVPEKSETPTSAPPSADANVSSETDFSPRSHNSQVDTRVHTQNWQFNSADAEALFRQVDAVIDGLNNWQHKLVASDLCMQLGKPLIHAGGAGFRYQVYTMAPPKSACLRCVFPEVGMDDVPLTPTDANTLSPVAAMVGALQALEAIKIVAKLGATQGNELWKFDWLSGEFETIRGLDPRFDCPDCGRHLRRE